MIIGIIGAGAAGLCTLKNSLALIPDSTPISWEKSCSLGGTWVYSDNNDKDEFGLPMQSSIYKSLRTDIPKEIMAFPDFPFKSEEDSFLDHNAMKEYLKDYAEHFNLLKHINFHHNVEEVCRISSVPGEFNWSVTVRNLKTDAVTTTRCHALVVCNGHFSVPSYPKIPGIEEFEGSTLHSHYYRVPDAFHNKTVIVLGASNSGRDISLELGSVAQKVYLSHNLALPMPSPSFIEQVAGVSSFEQSKNTFVLKDGRRISADAIIYCTGYHYSFPFLSEDCEVQVSNNIVWPLHKHLIHCKYPTMAFVGIPVKMIPFPFFNVQVEYFLLSLIDKIRLPASDQMLRNLEEELERNRSLGEKPRHHHSMAAKMWSYVDSLQQDINQAKGASESVTSFPPHVRQTFMTVLVRLMLQYESFKNYRYSAVREGEEEVVVVTEVYAGEEVRTAADLLWLLLRTLPGYILRNLTACFKLFLEMGYYKIKDMIFYR